MIKPQPTIQDYLAVLRRGVWIVFFSLVFGGTGSVFYLWRSVPLYQASTLILVEPQQIPQEYVKSTVTSDITGQLTTISHQVLSRTYLERVLEEYPELGGSPLLPIEDRIEGIKERIEVKTIGKDAFRLFFTGENPYIVEAVTNLLATMFIQENLRAREEQADLTSQFLERELDAMKESLEITESELRQFKELHMGELPEQLEANLRMLDRLQEQLTQVEVSIDSLVKERALLIKEVEKQRNLPQGKTPLAPRNQLAAELQQKEKELTALRTRFTDQHPDVIALQSDIALLRERQAAQGEVRAEGESAHYDPEFAVSLRQIDEFTLEIQRKEQERTRIHEDIAKYQQRVENAPKLEQELASLQRDYNNTKNNYMNLLNKKLDARLARNMEIRQQGTQFRILDPARLPTKPVKPNRLKILLLGLGAGVGSGLGIVFGLSIVDRKIRSRDDIGFITDLPILGEIAQQ